jgi:hypothetical protein
MGMLDQRGARRFFNSWTSRRIRKTIMSPPFEMERSSDFPLEPVDTDSREYSDVAE